MQKTLEAERLQHNDEIEQQRALYQKLLLEHHALEKRTESMQEQLARSAIKYQHKYSSKNINFI